MNKKRLAKPPPDFRHLYGGVSLTELEESYPPVCTSFTFEIYDNLKHQNKVATQAVNVSALTLLSPSL